MARIACIAALIAGAPASVHAHAFGQRYDLPLPLSYWLAGAGAAVVLSFAAGAVLLKGPQHQQRARAVRGKAWPWWFRIPVRVAAVGLFATLIFIGLAGPQDEPQDNLLTVTVWVLWWVGLTFIVAIAGDVWRSINPLRIIAAWMAAVAGMIGMRPSAPPLRLPPSVGVWPAVALFICFAWAELIWTSNGIPAKLAVAILLYSALTLAAMAAFGIGTWLRRGDPFSRFFALVGRFAPFDVASLCRRSYTAPELARPARSASEAVFVLVVLATVSFDGLKETPFWAYAAGGAMDMLYRAGVVAHLGTVWAESLVSTMGLIALPLVMLAAYWATCLAMCRVVQRVRPSAQPPDVATVALAFAPSLVPIAIGYHIAHYFSYLMIQGQWIVPALSDPLGYGWNLLGTRGYEPDIGIVDAATTWWAAVIAIVAGHAAAVLVAHLAARRMFVERRAVLVSQAPMLVLMVGYTMLSLWILAQPITMH